MLRAEVRHFQIFSLSQFNKIQCFIMSMVMDMNSLMFRSRSHHIDHQDVPDASREEDDAEDNGDDVLGQYFNEQFFLFSHGCVGGHF